MREEPSLLPNPIAAASEVASRLGSPQCILSYLAARDLSDPISVPLKPPPSHPSTRFLPHHPIVFSPVHSFQEWKALFVPITCLGQGL